MKKIFPWNWLTSFLVSTIWFFFCLKFLAHWWWWCCAIEAQKRKTLENLSFEFALDSNIPFKYPNINAAQCHFAFNLGWVRMTKSRTNTTKTTSSRKIILCLTLLSMFSPRIDAGKLFKNIFYYLGRYFRLWLFD